MTDYDDIENADDEWDVVSEVKVTAEIDCDVVANLKQSWFHNPQTDNKLFVNRQTFDWENNNHRVKLINSNNL